MIWNYFIEAVVTGGHTEMDRINLIILFLPFTVCSGALCVELMYSIYFGGQS